MFVLKKHLQRSQNKQNLTDRDEVKGNGQIMLKANKSSHPWKRLFLRYKYAHNNFLNYGSFKVLFSIKSTKNCRPMPLSIINVDSSVRFHNFLFMIFLDILLPPLLLLFYKFTFYILYK